MLKYITIAVIVPILVVLIFALTKPDTFHVQRATTIKAPTDKVFALINDFRNWGIWSPWEKLDPAMQKTHSGAASGKGAVYGWQGNKAVGKGSMEILESSPPSKIKIKLDFIEPYEGHNTAEFTLEAKGDATNVIWAMYGPNHYMAKLMSIFFSMDSMIGKDFEVGLANLKAIAEK